MEKRARVHCANARAQIDARAFFVINSCRTATAPFILLEKSLAAARLLLHSKLEPHHRAIDLAMSLCTVDSTSPPAASLMVWRLGSKKLQEFARRIISHKTSSDEPTHISSPISTSRLYKLPTQTIYCYSIYKCTYDKGAETLVENFWLDAFNFGDPVDIRLSLWHEKGSQRTNFRKAI